MKEPANKPPQSLPRRLLDLGEDWDDGEPEGNQPSRESPRGERRDDESPDAEPPLREPPSRDSPDLSDDDLPDLEWWHREWHHREGLYAGYHGNRPLGDYALLMGAYASSFAGFLALARRMGRPLPRRVTLPDVVLLGVATHRLSRLIARERITSAIRAPFTEYEGRGSGPNEVRERPRGGGVRRSIGELLTCPWCTGVWTATFLAYGFVLWPRGGRLVAAIFAADGISDFLHLGYGAMKKLS